MPADDASLCWIYVGHGAQDVRGLVISEVKPQICTQGSPQITHTHQNPTAKPTSQEARATAKPKPKTPSTSAL